MAEVRTRGPPRQSQTRQGWAGAEARAGSGVAEPGAVAEPTRDAEVPRGGRKARWGPSLRRCAEPYLFDANSARTL